MRRAPSLSWSKEKVLNEVKVNLNMTRLLNWAYRQPGLPQKSNCLHKVLSYCCVRIDIWTGFHYVQELIMDSKSLEHGYEYEAMNMENKNRQESNYLIPGWTSVTTSSCSKKPKQSSMKYVLSPSPPLQF